MDAELLISIVNTKLRDSADAPEDIFFALGLEPDEAERTLAAAGAHYDAEKRRYCRTEE